MKRILNYFIGAIITLLFLIFNDLDAIPSKYRLGIATVILIFDAIVLAYELINSMKKNKSAGVVVCYIIISIIYNHKKKVEIE